MTFTTRFWRAALLIAVVASGFSVGCGDGSSSGANNEDNQFVTGGGNSVAVRIVGSEASLKFPDTVTSFRVKVFNLNAQLLGQTSQPRTNSVLETQVLTVENVPVGPVSVITEALGSGNTTLSYSTSLTSVPVPEGQITVNQNSFVAGPAPSPTPIVSPTPVPSPGTSPTASPGSSPTASPGSSPSASPGSSPSASPSSSPSASPGSSPSASPGSSPSASPVSSPVVPSAITLFSISPAGNITSGEGFPSANGSVISTHTHPTAGVTVPGSRITFIEATVNGTRQTSNSSHRPTCSDDGQWTAFTSSNPFVPGVTGNGDQIYLYNNFTRLIKVATSTSSGAPITNNTFPTGGNANFGPAVSATGRYVLFFANNPGLPGASNVTHCYRKDTESGEVVLVSANAQGQAANAGSGGQLTISSDGNICAFSSSATNLVNATFTGSIVMVKNVNTGAVAVGSLETFNGVTRPTGGGYLCLSGDGRYLLFATAASGGTTWRTEVGTNNTIQLRPNLGAGISSPSFQIDQGWMSGDGRFVVYSSGTQWDPAVTNGTHCYVTDITAANQTTRVVDVSAGGAAGNGSVSLAPKISRDGRRICFSSSATNLVSLPTNTTTAFGLGYIAPNPLQP